MSFAYSLGIVIVFLVLVAIGKWNKTRNQHTYSSDVLRASKKFVANGLHYSQLSMQDTDPIFAFWHIGYALTYLDAARCLMSDADLEQITGINVKLLFELSAEHQQTCLHVLKQ